MIELDDFIFVSNGKREGGGYMLFGTKMDIFCIDCFFH